MCVNQKQTNNKNIKKKHVKNDDNSLDFERKINKNNCVRKEYR